MHIIMSGKGIKKGFLLGASCIAVLVLIFFALRLFTPSSTYIIAGDEARYLGLAKPFARLVLGLFFGKEKE